MLFPWINRFRTLLSFFGAGCGQVGLGIWVARKGAGGATEGEGE
jgi:hypothetical protein